MYQGIWEWKKPSKRHAFKYNTPAASGYAAGFKGRDDMRQTHEIMKSIYNSIFLLYKILNMNYLLH